MTKVIFGHLACTVRSLSEASKRTAYMQVLFDVSERERTVVVEVTMKSFLHSFMFVIDDLEMSQK